MTPPAPFRSTLTAKHVDAIGGFAQAARVRARVRVRVS
jgi:hypothetical protein